MKILLVLDNPKRDLESTCLVAAKLKESGHEVAVTLMESFKLAFYHFRPDHVLLNYLRVSNQNFVKEILKFNVAYSVLDTEGGVFTSLNDKETSYSKTIIKNEELKKHISNYFCWGESIYNFLQHNNIYPAQSIVLSGTPRTDVYHYYAHEKNEHKANNAHILINTSFPLVNPKFVSAEREIQMLIKSFNYSEEYLNQKLAFMREVQAEYIKLCLYLAEKFPDRNIIFRPHPFENEEFYISYFKNHSNIKVTCEGGVAKWIKDSVLLIHFECSTAIEAGMLSKQSLSLKKFKDYYPVEATYPFTTFCENFEEVERIIKDQIAQPKLASYGASLAPIYFKIDGQAHLRVVEKINNSKQTNPLYSEFAFNAFTQLVINFIKCMLKKFNGYFKPTKNITAFEMHNALKINKDITNVDIYFKNTLANTYWIINQVKHSA